jgi:hypothetical protein
MARPFKASPKARAFLRYGSLRSPPPRKARAFILFYRKKVTLTQELASDEPNVRE